MMDYKTLIEGIVAVAEKTGLFIMAEAEHFDISLTEHKGVNDFVSYVDREAEKMIVEGLEKLIPGAGFLAEEEIYSAGNGSYRWIIDPLDGTTNFIHNLHPFAVSIALEEEGQITAGVVYEASGKEIFMAWKNGGAWLNGRKIKVSKAYKLADSLVATGFPYKNFKRLPSYMECLEYLMKNTHGIRRMGSASIDLAYVACGRFEVFYEYSLNPWDVAAGTLLVREAGGIVTDFSGKNENITGEEIIASNSRIHHEILKIINKFMR